MSSGKEAEEIYTVGSRTMRRSWPGNVVDEIGWAIHTSYPCEHCSCGERGCARPRFVEIQAAIRVLSYLSDEGLVDAPWEAVP